MHLAISEHYTDGLIEGGEFQQPNTSTFRLIIDGNKYMKSVLQKSRAQGRHDASIRPRVAYKFGSVEFRSNFSILQSGPKGTSDLKINSLTATNEHSKCRQWFSVIYRRVPVNVSALLRLAQKKEQKMKSAEMEGLQFRGAVRGNINGEI